MNKILMLVLCAPLMAGAGTIFTDDFEANLNPFDLNVVPIGWTVNAGTVDVISFGCHSGARCVDLDGSSGQAGTLSRDFAVTAGQADVLTFWLNNSNRGTDENVDVVFGTTLLSIPVPSTMPLTQFTLNFTPLASGTATVSFHNLGGDNIGALLDDVTVATAAAGVPEPASWVLFASAFAAIAFLRSRRVNG